MLCVSAAPEFRILKNIIWSYARCYKNKLWLYGVLNNEVRKQVADLLLAGQYFRCSSVSLASCSSWILRKLPLTQKASQDCEAVIWQENRVIIRLNVSVKFMLRFGCVATVVMPRAWGAPFGVRKPRRPWPTVHAVAGNSLGPWEVQ